MKHIKGFQLFENEQAPIQKPADLKALKKLMRKVSNDRGGEKTGFDGFWGDFSNGMGPNHRGNFVFIENEMFWNEKGEMSYTGSGNPEVYIDRVNKNFLNKVGWEMVHLGQRTVKVQKLEK